MKRLKGIKMMRRMICLGLFFLCGCYHTLEFVNLDHYSVDQSSRVQQKYKRIFVDMKTASVSSDQFEKVFMKALEERTDGQVVKGAAVEKGEDDLTFEIKVSEFLDGKMSNFALSWPGFMIFLPAWYGYGYVAQYKVDVDIYAGNNSKRVRSLFIPINFEMRHAEYKRTWGATGFGWFTLTISAAINGVHCMIYDTDLTPELYRRAFGVMGEYAANEVVKELKKMEASLVVIDGAAKVVRAQEEEKKVEVKAESVRLDVKEGEEEEVPTLDGGYRKSYEVDVGNEEAMNKALRDARAGDAGAQYFLGRSYEFGKGVEQSNEEANKWWRKAAEQGHAGAQYFLGRSYEFGKGVEQSNEEANKWYRKAAEQGNANAKRRLKIR
jgi:hypothetical protein